MNLNIPDTRQNTLAQRLRQGEQVVASDAAREFGVSIDTIRRDILALEAEGAAQRVRGGAIPVATPALPLHRRMHDAEALKPALINAAVAEIAEAPTLLVDGGVTALCVIRRLPAQEGRLIITPSPWVAILCQEKAIDVFLLGGRLRPQGGMTAGEMTIDRTGKIAADIALLGACGIEAGFGLSSDDHDEARMKQAMHDAARRTVVVTQAAKIGRRARHHTLALRDIDLVITDAAPEMTSPLSAAGTRVASV